MARVITSYRSQGVMLGHDWYLCRILVCLVRSGGLLLANVFSALWYCLHVGEGVHGWVEFHAICVLLSLVLMTRQLEVTGVWSEGRLAIHVQFS